MKKNRRYYKELYRKLKYGDMHSMTAEEIFDLEKYSAKVELKANKGRKFMLVSSVFYFLTITTSTISNAAEFDNTGVMVILTFLSTALFLTATIRLMRRNFRSSDFQFLKYDLKHIKNHKKEELDAYRQKINRDKNIDNILQS